ALLLSACSIPTATAAPTTSLGPLRPSLPSPTLRPPTQAPTATATPAGDACLQRRGRMVVRELVDPDLPRSIPFRIYLPPCFVEHPSWRYPTLYLFHGATGTDSQWDEMGADETAEELIAAGEAPPFLIVMPWERLGLDWQDAILNHLVPYVETVYRASPDRGLRAFGGLSRGAGWAFRIGFGHPRATGAVGMHSPAILPPDLYLVPIWVQDLPPQELPRLWIDIGDHDSLRPSTLELTALLDSLQVRYTWNLFPGDHLWEYWESHLGEYLRWYAEGWPLALQAGR
ncbi:MAG: alpha/beta hydrolase, partial [Gemmatimonadales bacterium]